VAGRRRRSSTAVRLAALHGTILAVVLGAVAAALVSSFSTSYETVAAGSLATELRTFANAAARRPPSETLERFAVTYLRSHALASGGAVLVALSDGARVETSDGVALERSPVVATLLGQSPATSQAQATTIGGRPVELAVAPLVEGARRVGRIIATADLRPFAAERSRVLGLSLAEAAVALVAGVASSYVLLRQLLRSVGRITSAADEIGRSSLDRRLGEQGAEDEMGDLARTFDEMLDRIASAMEAQRRLLADVSHQLRTPLTVARGHLEVLGRTGTGDPGAVKETIDLVVDEIGHMGAVVERLLMLGHAMDPNFLTREPVDLRALLADCLASARVLGPRALTLGPVPDLVLVVDGAKLRGAVLNLVANAVQATQIGDPVQLSAALDAVQGEVALLVEDAGPGIPENERALALERFARPGTRPPGGTGLGLAIVRAVAEAHGGRVAIGDSPLGGALVEIVLPVPGERLAEQD
jgi:signal transduction histidine kinase